MPGAPHKRSLEDMTDPLTIKQEALRLIHETEAREGLQRFIYEGQCMSPALRDGDLLLVKAVTARELRAGDIVLFRQSGKLWVHRFLCLKKAAGHPGWILTKPDNTLKLDEPFTESDLVGVVEESQRKSRRFRLRKGGPALLSRLIGLTALGEASGYRLVLKIRRLLRGRLRLPWRLRKIMRTSARIPKAILVRLLTFLSRSGK